MYTYTTPTMRFVLEDDIDLTEMNRVWVTIKDEDGNVILNRDMTVESESTAFVVLTQAETASLPIGTHKAQVNYTWTTDGGGLRRGATHKAEVYVLRNNDEEEVT